MNEVFKEHLRAETLASFIFYHHYPSRVRPFFQTDLYRPSFIFGAYKKPYLRI